MPQLFEYRDASLYCHHTLDTGLQGFPMHAHEMYEVFYFISGSCTALVEGHEYRLQPGDLLLMRSAEAHKTVLHSSAPYERIAIHFAPELLRPLDPEGLLERPFTGRSLGSRNLYRAPEEAEAPWRRYFEKFDLPQTAPDGRKRLHVLSRLLGILTEVSAAYEQTGAQAARPSDLPHRLIEYVNEHLFEEISLRSISEAFYLSQSQVSRIFRQAAGSPCWKYIQIKRLLAAREKLRHGEPAVKACEACGFGDYSAFYRAYRAQFGCAPSERET